ncbi:MAG: phosphatase PAP2 family protein [Polyangiaceae bacterium]|jgi:hypothetical protein
MSIFDAGKPHPSRSRHGSPLRVQSPAVSQALGMRSFGMDSSGPERLASGAALLVGNFASQDWLILGYLVALLVALALGAGHNRAACAVRVCADLTGYLFVLTMVRVPLLRWSSSLSSLLYRLAVVATVVGSFFQLREILPAVSPWADDSRIYAFDLHVFGFEPSVWLDRFVSRPSTEWFAFFYFLYFLILTIHVLPMLLFERNVQVLGRFAVGLLLVFLTAHLLYMVVPGWGPYWYLHESFRRPLVGGPFWKLVGAAVDAGGAQKDIFPSLHTAVPTFFAIFSCRHRKLAPFKYTWLVMSFFATQMILATMFLRWHYLVDVVAGVTLAVAGAYAGARIADWEYAKRERLGLQAAWMPLVYPWERTGGG